MSTGGPGFSRTPRTLLWVMSWLPASPSMYTGPLRFTIIPCSSAMRGSGRWISQLALRPTRTHSVVTVFWVCVVRPPPRGVRVRMRNFTARASPVDEDRDHVRRERGEQHECERHVEVEPEVEHRLVAQVAARALEQLVLLQQQGVDLLVEPRALAGEPLRVLRPLAHRRGGGTLPVAPGKKLHQASAQARAGYRPVPEGAKNVGGRRGLLAHLAVEGGEAQHDRLQRVLAPVGGHRARHAHGDEDAKEPP